MSVPAFYHQDQDGALHKAVRCLFKYILITSKQFGALSNKVIKLPKNVGLPAPLPVN